MLDVTVDGIVKALVGLLEVRQQVTVVLIAQQAVEPGQQHQAMFEFLVLPVGLIVHTLFRNFSKPAFMTIAMSFFRLLMKVE